MPERNTDLTRKLVEDGLRPKGERAFSDYPPELQAAVEAYDLARRTAWGRSTREAAMSDANKASIVPMIAAAIVAYLDATKQERAA